MKDGKQCKVGRQACPCERCVDWRNRAANGMKDGERGTPYTVGEAELLAQDDSVGQYQGEIINFLCRR